MSFLHEEVSLVQRAAGGRVKLRLFVDGASRGNPGPAGLGVVVQDGRGRTIAELADFLGETTNNVAEYRALLRALEEARARDADDVEIHADSDLLVRQVGGTYRVKSPHLIPLHEEALRALAGFKRWRISHVPRGRNAAADALANAAIDAATGRRHVELTVLVEPVGAGWKARVAVLPDCEALGSTPDEALARVEAEATSRLAEMRAKGTPLPREHRIHITLSDVDR